MTDRIAHGLPGSRGMRATRLVEHAGPPPSLVVAQAALDAAPKWHRADQVGERHVSATAAAGLMRFSMWMFLLAGRALHAPVQLDWFP
jgi:hypothetical protein